MVPDGILKPLRLTRVLLILALLAPVLAMAAPEASAAVKVCEEGVLVGEYCLIEGPAPVRGAGRCPTSDTVYEENGLCYSLIARPHGTVQCDPAAVGYNVAPYLKEADGTCKWVFPGSSTTAADNVTCPHGGKMVKATNNGHSKNVYCVNPTAPRADCPPRTMQVSYNQCSRQVALRGGKLRCEAGYALLGEKCIRYANPTDGGVLAKGQKLCSGDQLTWTSGPGHWWVTVGNNTDSRYYMNNYAGGPGSKSITLQGVPASGKYEVLLWNQANASSQYVVTDRATYECGTTTAPTPTPIPEPTPTPVPSTGTAEVGKFLDANKLCNADSLQWTPGSGYWWITVGTHADQRAYMNEYAGGSSASSMQLSNVPASGSYTAFLWRQTREGASYQISDAKEFSCSPNVSGQPTTVGSITAPAGNELCSGDQISWNPGSGYWWLTVGNSGDRTAYMNDYVGGSSAKTWTAHNLPSQSDDIVVNLWRQNASGQPYNVVDTKTFSCGSNAGGGSGETLGTITSPDPLAQLCPGDWLNWTSGSGYWWVTVGNSYNQRAYMNAYAGGSASNKIRIDMPAGAQNPIAYLWHQVQSGQPYKLVNSAAYSTCTR